MAEEVSDPGLPQSAACSLLLWVGPELHRGSPKRKYSLSSTVQGPEHQLSPGWKESRGREDNAGSKMVAPGRDSVCFKTSGLSLLVA